MVGKRSPSLGAVFVGRDELLSTLRRLLADALGHRGHLVLLAGEPGIGKTTLAQRFIDQAAPGEVTVLRATCWDGTGAPALWPWIQVLRELTVHRDVKALAARLGPVASELHRLIPEVVARREGAESGGGDPEQARFRLFDAVASLLRAAAADRAVLVLLDDLHWADSASLLLLEFLLADLGTTRIMVLGCYRDAALATGHGLHRLIGERTGAQHVLRLRGLTRDEVAALLALVGGADVAAAVVDRVHRATGGNPFFVREMVRLAAAPGAPEEVRVTLAAEIPGGVRETVRRRLARLSAPCREVLAAASVIGADFPLEVIPDMTGMPGADAVAVLEEAVAVRLIDELPGSSDRFGFTHALVREVVYDALPRRRRVDLHRKAAESIERRSADDLEPRLAELAHHFAHAAVGGDAGRAVEYAGRAGHHALAVLAYEDAVAHFERALGLLRWELPDTAVRRGELLLALGRAQMAAGQIAAARSAYEEAARLAVTAEILARAALGLGQEFTAGVVDEVEVRLLEQALDALPDTPSALRARVQGRLAKALLFTPLVQRREALSAGAVAMAKRVGEPAALAAVLYERHIAIWAEARAAERLAITDEVVSLAERCGDRDLTLQGRALRIGNLLELGDMSAYDREVDAYAAMTERMRQNVWHVPFLRATQAFLSCRFEDAERLAAGGRALGQRAPHQGISVFFPVLLFAIRMLQGRLSEMEPALREAIVMYPGLPAWRAALTVALLESQRDEEARMEFERLTVDDLAGVPRDFTWVVSLALLAQTCAQLDDGRRAAALHELLAPHARYCVRVTRVGVLTLGSVSHYLGLLAATMARWDAAVGHFEAAIDMNARIGAPGCAANSRYQLGRVLRQRGGAGDEERAREQLHRATAAARALGVA
ncbi:MAG: ATP-binding protein, partial [Candidatus Rokuibacteriota bacterium]